MTEKVRVWVDGCFDMLHFGHANALRQAKELGDYLIVGIHSDEEIKINKGLPVFNEEERYKIMRSIKWVDEIVENAPYTTHVETLENFNCDFCAHGDDLTTTVDGLDTYHLVKAANKFKEFKRTQGISTTDLVNRILHLGEDQGASGRDHSQAVSKYTKGSDFLATSLRIAQFQLNLKESSPEDIVIYAPGTYDLFHVGHCMFLEQCSKLGTYLIVGLYSDETAKAIYGEHFPIITLYERLLSILSCKFVSNVVVCPPYEITQDMMEVLKIDLVVHGSTDGEKIAKIFEVPKKMNKFKMVDSGSKLTLEILIDRIKKNKEEYECRNTKKEHNEIIFGGVSDLSL